MITVGGFNTSIDKTLEVDELRPGRVHRVRRVQAWPGGKGLHVALTVAALGEKVRLVGLIDAAHRLLFEEALERRGVEFEGVETCGPLRTCLAVRDQGGARITEILEPGPELQAEEGDRLRARFLSSARGSTLAVLSGSAPPGMDDDTYADLAAGLRTVAIPCLVDASGGLLRRAVEARPSLVKPNREEAEALTGERIDSPAAAARVARALVARGIGMAIVTLGAAGAVAARDERVLHAWLPVAGATHPVGSGDCLLGGIAVGLARGASMDDTLRLGVACGGANAITPDTGWIRPEDVEDLRPRVSVAWIA